MTTGHVFIATSLDGFIARTDDALDWLTKQDTGTEDHGYDTFIASVDGLVMGRGSFRTVLGFDHWPYTKPVVVLSQSMTQNDIPKGLTGDITLTRETPRQIMTRLAAMGWSRAYIDGGLVVQSFLREGLIADMRVTVIPILLGQGKRLFGKLDADIDLHFVKTTPFPSGLVALDYKVAQAG